jgi:hypothetical protein
MKKYVKGNKPQLINAMKYFSKFGPATAVALGATKKISENNTYWWYFTFQMISTVYSAFWDFKWDWGLFRGTKPGRKFLRDDITYSPLFYYFAITMNIVFRLWWLIGMLIKMGVESS